VWVTGAITFLVAVPAALTGYVSQQNFDAQWISTLAKDGLNSVGVGAFFNVTNFGQMYSYHVLLLPLAVMALIAAHILLVRKHGIVPPFDLSARENAIGLGAEASPGPAEDHVSGHGAGEGLGAEALPVAESGSVRSGGTT
jgi:hypothetical protein